MRKIGRFHPNVNGIIEPRKQTFTHGGHVQVYSKPDNSINKIDRLRSGNKPRIAITRKQGGAGDVLMTTPTVKAICKKYDIKIDYGTDFEYLKGSLVDCLKYNPYINKIVPWREINNKDYDAVIDLTCPCVAHEKPLAPPINRVDLFARHANVTLEDTRLDYYIQKDEELWAEKYLSANNLDMGRLIFVQPSSSTTTRDVPVEALQKALAKVMVAKRDVKVIVSIPETYGDTTDWNFGKIHLLKNPTVREIAAIMKKTDLLVCPDSLFLHIGAALYHPTFTIFGPTDPYARVNYHPEAVAYWTGKDLPGYPTWYTPGKDNYVCWRRVDQSLMVNTIIAMLDKAPLPETRELITFGNFAVNAKRYEKI